MFEQDLSTYSLESVQSPCRPWTKSVGSLWVASFLWCLTVITGRLTEEFCSGTQRFRIKKSHQWFWQLHFFVSGVNVAINDSPGIKGRGSTPVFQRVWSWAILTTMTWMRVCYKHKETWGFKSSPGSVAWISSLPMSVWGLCTLWP